MVIIFLNSSLSKINQYDEHIKDTEHF